MASPASARTFQEALDEALNALRAANPEHAVVVCDELLSASGYPDAVRALRLRGQALEALGDVMRAALDYERVLEICPTDTITALSYTKSLSRLGRKEEAALIAHQLLDWMPNDMDIQHIASEGVAVQAYDAPQSSGRLAAAQAQFAVGRTQLALNTARKVVIDSLDRADARLMLATFLWRDGKRIQAAEHCQQLLDDEPDCLLAHALLVYIWNGTDALQQWHLRSIDRLDPDHREVTQSLVPVGGPALFEVIEVPATPPVAGFAEEDVHDVSDDPDHDDFMDRLLASAGPINAQAQPPVSPTPARAALARPAVNDVDADNTAEDLTADNELDEDDIVHYSKLDWEPEHEDDSADADGGTSDEADTPPPWLTQVRASSRPLPEGTSIDDGAEDDPAEYDATDAMAQSSVPVTSLTSLAETDADDNGDDNGDEDGNEDEEEGGITQTRAVRKAEAWQSETIGDTAPASATAPQTTQSATTPPATDPGAWLEAARAAINQRMSANSAESQLKMTELAERMNAALADLQTLAATQPDPEWYTLLGMAYTIKGKVDAALAESRQGPGE